MVEDDHGIQLLPDLHGELHPGSLSEATFAGSASRDRVLWSYYRVLFHYARSGLVELRQSGGAEDFEPHHGPGWYLEQIVSCEQRVRLHVEQNDAAAAAMAAFDLGRAHQEYLIKFAFDEVLKSGMKHRGDLAAGAQARRKAPQTERVAKVEELLAKGISKRNAFSIVARQEGTHASTIQRDCYMYWNARKKTSST